MFRLSMCTILVVAVASALAAQDGEDPPLAEGAKAAASKAGENPPDKKPVDGKPAEPKPADAKPDPAKLAIASSGSVAIKVVSDADNVCIACHSHSSDKLVEWDPKDKEMYKYHIPLEAFQNDIHWQKGVRCQDCHGGDASKMEVPDPRQAHLSKDDFRVVHSPADIPEFCGRCHSNAEYMRHFVPAPRTDELSEYWTSQHGKKLKTGDTKVATCISCHGKPHGNATDKALHGIRAVKEPDSPVYHTKVAQTCAKCHSDKDLMAGRTYKDQPLPCDEYAKWRQSVHGKALMDKGDFSAPACNNCHGNHGAAPPQVDSVANACGTCHGKIAGLFAETKMRHAFEKVGLPGCATCHSNHLIHQPTDEFLGMQSGAFCVRCHEQGNLKHGATLAGTEAAKKLHDGIDHLKTEITTADATLTRAEELGMEVSKPKFDLRKASDALTNARTMVHSFDVATVDKALEVGTKVVEEVQGKGDKALRDYTERRIWLASSLVPILIVIGLLLLYIRSMPAEDAKK